MSLNKKVGFLLDNGFNPDFISSLNEAKINVIYERMNKRETKEVVMIPKDNSVDIEKAKAEKKTIEVYEDDTEIDQDPYGSYRDTQQLQQRGPSDYGNNPKLDKKMDDYDADGMGIMEKFESKAQQGLFWARCNKCKTDDCKWCKMAKEFSKSTSKKQYKDMPEKKHPEKTVKYKKKQTSENFTFKEYLDKLGSTYTSEMMKKPIGFNPTFSESVFKKNLENIIQENLKPTMKKGDLIRLIERTMTKTKETETKPDVKPDVKPGEKPTKTPNPFKKPNPNPAEAKLERLQRKLEKTDDESEIKKIKTEIKNLKKEMTNKNEFGESKSDFMSRVKKMGFLNK